MRLHMDALKFKLYVTNVENLWFKSNLRIPERSSAMTKY